VFSNKYMQLAVGASALLLILVIYVPFLNPIFNTFPLTLRDWGVILPLILLPSVAAEIMKWMMRTRGQNPAQTVGDVPGQK
jgi:Ca2+-transporting ATPase